MCSHEPCLKLCRFPPLEAEQTNLAVAELSTSPAAQEIRHQKKHQSNSNKHKKQKIVTGAADFSAEDVAHRKQKWEARQASRNMESLLEVRESLPIAALRSVHSAYLCRSLCAE